MSLRKRVMLFSVLMLCRYAVISLGVSMIVGTLILHSVNAQSTNDRFSAAARLAVIEYSNAQLVANQTVLAGQVSLLSEKINTMEGVAFGLGAIVIVIQIIQMVTSRGLSKRE